MIVLEEWFCELYMNSIRRFEFLIIIIILFLQSVLITTLCAQ